MRKAETAELVWVGGIAGGLACNLWLHRGGRPLLCHVARNWPGFALWIGFGLHLFIRPLDPVHLIANLYRRYLCPSS